MGGGKKKKKKKRRRMLIVFRFDCDMGSSLITRLRGAGMIYKVGLGCDAPPLAMHDVGFATAWTIS